MMLLLSCSALEGLKQTLCQLVRFLPQGWEVRPGVCSGQR
jgi:hypothetical protein